MGVKISNTYKRKILKIVGTAFSDEFKLSSPSKISKKTGKAFSLPAGPETSCIGATEACVDCYAKKGFHIMDRVMANFAGNWNLLLKYEVANDIEGCAEALCVKIPDKGIFRIHESGDFHSNFAIKVWAAIAKKKPKTDFYAYTRSFTLRFYPLLRQPNFALWASTDNYNEKQATAFVKRYQKSGVKHAYGPWGDEEIPSNSFICPTTNGKLNISGACEKCQLCVIPERTQRNVVFMRH